MKTFFNELIQPKADKLKELLNENKPADDFINFITNREIKNAN